MIPKVGQLLQWYDHSQPRAFVERPQENNDIGIVKEVHLEGVHFFDDDAYEYVVVIDWCKGPHHSEHDQEEYEESITRGEIVVVE